ncbi:MAG: GDP-mannose 4,6-dehydratase [Myxococcaceae bacterium]
MRVLVTGADGFVGRHLVPALARAGHEVVPAAGPTAELRALDITRAEQVRRLIAEVKPEGLIHLAGQSSVAKSHDDPAQSFAVNALGTVNLLCAVREHVPTARLLLVGSGEMYGPVPVGELANEDTPLLPNSPYAAAKVAGEHAGLQFWQSYGIPVISARPFNHLGPGQQRHFVVPSFAAQVAAIARGEQAPEIRAGNLEPLRDFSHVQDVVNAYVLLLEKGIPGQAYNVCSATARSVRSVLDELLSLAKVTAHVELDPAKPRPAEIPSLAGSNLKLRALGWAPRRTVTQALTEVLAEMDPSALS